MSVCKKCGKQIADNEKYCSNHKLEKNLKIKKIIERSIAFTGITILVIKKGGKELQKIYKKVI